MDYKVDQVFLIRDCGILNILYSGKSFTSSSPEVLGVKQRILARVSDWEQQFSFNFSPEQAPISFLTRAAKCLGIKFHVTRSGVDDRLYQYQVCSLGLIDDLIDKGMKKLDGVRVDDEVKKERWRKKLVKNITMYNSLLANTINLRPQAPFLWADQEEELNRLLDLYSQVEIQANLLKSALDCYSAAIAEVSGIEGLASKSTDGD
jgi:hypothetical protein